VVSPARLKRGVCWPHGALAELPGLTAQSRAKLIGRSWNQRRSNYGLNL
jgi:hypothetical protein